jgi:hypothetical protein
MADLFATLRNKMGKQKTPHTRTLQTGKVIKVGIRGGEPAPLLTYNKPKGTTDSLIFKPNEVIKTRTNGTENQQQKKDS